MKSIVDKMQEGFFDNVSAGNDNLLEKEFEIIVNNLLKKFKGKKRFPYSADLGPLNAFASKLPSGSIIRYYDGLSAFDYEKEIRDGHTYWDYKTFYRAVGSAHTDQRAMQMLADDMFYVYIRNGEFKFKLLLA